MANPTPLILAHQAMQSAPEDDAARLRFFSQLADTPLFLLLESEDQGAAITPKTIQVNARTYVECYDQEETLAAQTGAPVPYATVPGRDLATLLAEQGLGLRLHSEPAENSLLIAPEDLAWLALVLTEMHETSPYEQDAALAAISPPRDVPPELLTVLDAKLAKLTGLADAAYLVATQAKSGEAGHLLAFLNAAPGAQNTLMSATQEALAFSGCENVTLDLAFLEANAALFPAIERNGLRFDLPQAPKAKRPSAPGMDPDRPPRLR